jgi:hypothetical protein
MNSKDMGDELGQTKEILCCSGGNVLGPGSVGRLENDNNSHVTIATINY